MPILILIIAAIIGGGYLAERAKVKRQTLPIPPAPGRFRGGLPAGMRFGFKPDSTTISREVSAMSQPGGPQVITGEVRRPLGGAGASAPVPPGGSGGAGGTGGAGGGGGCFSGDVAIRTAGGWARFRDLPRESPLLIENETGIHKARIVVHEDLDTELLDMGDGYLVTPDHLIRRNGRWAPAGDYFSLSSRVKSRVTVYNLHVLSPDLSDQHYILKNGWVAHNLKAQF